MPSEFVDAALRRFRVVPRIPGGRLESRSGARVQPVTTAGGDLAYAKTTPASLGPGALAAARRELRFYLELAPNAPVRTPALLDHLDTGDGVGLLLAATGGPLDVAGWTTAMWAALGRDLAALHHVPAAGWDGPDLLAAAMAEPDLAAIHAFWDPALPRLDDLLADAGRLAGAMSASPPVFTHGDCHTENITHADGSLILCDWQSARTGRPSSDLAFLSVRATPAGVTVPPALLDAYDPDRDDELRRAVAAEELAILIFQWPHFAAYNSADGIDRIRARAADLAQRWLHGRGSPGYS